MPKDGARRKAKIVHTNLLKLFVHVHPCHRVLTVLDSATDDSLIDSILPSSLVNPDLSHS